ncbi:MAG TPA: hypothetical protein EYG85_02970 [Crocinitomix sp.]|nr:hypothetical protein [Crocinitomix sp.]
MGRRIGTLGLVNYKDHPTDNRYVVFNFNSKAEADHFESLLNEKKINYESDTEQVEDKPVVNLFPSTGKMLTMYLFAINKRDFNKTQKLNYLTTAKFRQPSIKNKYLRIGLLFFFFLMLTLGIISYYMVEKQ